MQNSDFIKKQLILKLKQRKDKMQNIGKMICLWIVVFGLTLTNANGAPFREYPVGESVEINKLEIAAVWLPPVKMDHIKSMDDLRKKKAGQSIHIEADIHAIEANDNGFGAGEWIPSLNVSFTIEDANGVVTKGKLLPMVAKDGPHYGAQLFLPFNKYKLTFHIAPPDSKEFGRHTDSITGVAPWWKAFDLSWEFNFKGAKK